MNLFVKQIYCNSVELEYRAQVIHTTFFMKIVQYCAFGSSLKLEN